MGVIYVKSYILFIFIRIYGVADAGAGEMIAKDALEGIILEEFPRKRILVMGDLMVDEYVVGSVSRISPEAPVAVLNFEEKKRRAGGAANVAVNLRSLGASVIACGIAGQDDCGIWLRENLGTAGIVTDGIVGEEGRPTAVKTRFTTRGQQLLRVDSEKDECILPGSQRALLDFVRGRLHAVDAVILSDYRKGLFSDPGFIASLVSLCKDAGVLVTVDSKSRKMDKFKGADIIKPNKKELEDATGIKIRDDDCLSRAGFLYLEQSGAGNLVVTRGESGISLFSRDYGREDFASHALQVFDVTGAGDTVISTVTLGVSSGLPVQDSIRLANIAAGIVVGKAGTASVTAGELAGRIDAFEDL